MSKTLNLVDSLLARGRSMHRQGRLEQAVQVLKRLAAFRDLPPHVAEEAQARLGRLYLRRGALTRARRHLTTALVYRPDGAQYHYFMALAVAFGPRAQPERAADHFRRSLASEPEQPRCLIAFGRFCLQQERTEEGLELLRRAVELAPDDLTILRRGTTALARAGCWDEAFDLVRTARFRHPRDARLLTLWNDLLFRQVHGQQNRPRIFPVTDDGPVLLPFQRPHPAGANVAQATFRRDAASRLPAPHLLPRTLRRSDWKHG